MPDLQIFETSAAPAPVGPYSQAIRCGDLLFCSGQVALDAETGAVVGNNAAEQTKKIMANVEAVLGAAKLGFNNVVKTTIFLTDMADFAQVNEIYGSYFKISPPARSCVEVSGLPKGVNVEIEVLAHF